MHANTHTHTHTGYGSQVERNQKHGRLNLRGVNKGPSESLESHAWHLGADKLVKNQQPKEGSSQRIGLIKILVV
jgi:hypothetical protein